MTHIEPSREALAEERLDRAAGGRRALKQEAQALEREGAAARGDLIAAARRRGVSLPEEAAAWPAKRLLRRALDREADAQVRVNPVRVDEAFACGHCGAQATEGGAQVRNHCPSCLRSLHVDEVPGDRAARCGGLMDPVGVEVKSAQTRLLHRCRRCGAERRVRAHPDDAPAALRALAASANPWGG